MIQDLIEACPTGTIYISDRNKALRRQRPDGPDGRHTTRFAHLRSGKIQEWASKEGCGVAVNAYGIDELGNVIAYTRSGFIKQYIGN